MKIQIASDLHREFLKPEQRNPSHKRFEPMIDVDDTADVIVLAGDIDVGEKSVKWMNQLGKPVIYIAGNHEYYKHDIAVGKRIFNEVRDHAPNVHFLDPGAVMLGDVLFVGGTLWTDFNLNGEKAHAMWTAPRYMADYRHTEGLTPEWVLSEHTRHREYIKDIIGANSTKKIVVVTHHLPSSRCIHPNWAQEHHSLSNAFYASEIPFVGAANLWLWIHGHTHESMDHEIDGTRIVCNPRGYEGYQLNPAFNPRLVVEV